MRLLIIVLIGFIAVACARQPEPPKRSGLPGIKTALDPEARRAQQQAITDEKLAAAADWLDERYAKLEPAKRSSSSLRRRRSRTGLA